MIWDPRDTGDDPEDETPLPRWLFLLGMFLWLCVAATLLYQCDANAAAPEPFAVVLPDGSEAIACGLRYNVPPAKLITLEPCVLIFASGFESLTPANRAQTL
jgi:hypothetical protein